MIEKGDAVLDKPAADVRVKTRKYSAVALKNIKAEERLCLCTAKKTSVTVNDFCSACGSAEKRQRLETCPQCGDSFCIHCWKDHRSCLADYDED